MRLCVTWLFHLSQALKKSVKSFSKDKINEKIVASTPKAQERNTNFVLDWHNKIQDKEHVSFMHFEFERYYPSITEELLSKVVRFAKNVLGIPHDDISIIMQWRKTLIFNEQMSWVKKDGNKSLTWHWAAAMEQKSVKL